MTDPVRLLSTAWRSLQASRAMRRLRAMSWPVWLGAGGWLVAVALAVLLAPAWRAQADEQLAAVARAASTAVAAARAPSPSPSQRPSAATLPDAGRTPQRSAEVLALARRQGLELRRVRETLDEAGHLQLSLGGQASYAAVRGFVAAALAADPALALDRLRLQRADAAGALLDVDMQWTLLHRAPPRERKAGEAVS